MAKIDKKELVARLKALSVMMNRKVTAAGTLNKLKTRWTSSTITVDA